MSNKLYDVLKWIAIVFLDAVGTAYRALAAVWNWPCGEEVMQTCCILSVCLGTLLGISSFKYSKEKSAEIRGEIIESYLGDDDGK